MTDFNIQPYFDDYNENKGYYKVLFRPSVAIQARELNQMQTMLQKQIERFGAHVFKDGSIVLGGGFDPEFDVPYVRASTVSNSARLNEFVGKIVVGSVSGLQAFIKAVEFDADNNVYVFMVRYTTSSETTNVFLSDETVTVTTDASLNFAVTPSSSVGIGSTFGIQSGVVFSRGYFVAFPTSTIILSKYSSTPSATVGLEVSEAFVTDLSDSTLLDNALGTTNENAPGAHRYQILTDLKALGYKDGYDDEAFIPLMDIKEGVIETKQDRPEYNRLLDELAKRTFDESGDYYVRGFNVRTREHLDTGTNEGLYTSNNGGNSSLLSIDVEPGLAYVKGYEVSNLVTQHIITDKATTFNFVNNQLVNARTGGYFLIKEIMGSIDHDEGIAVDLYDTAETRITSNLKNTTSPTGLKIGTARLKALVYENGILGKPNATMRAYLFDFNMNAGYVLSDARAIYLNSGTNKFFADIVLVNNLAIFYETNVNTLVFPINSTDTRSIRSNTGSSDTTFQFYRSEDLTANLDSSTALSSTPVTTVNEQLSYTTGALSTAEKRELILTINSDKDITLPGTITGTATEFTVTGLTTDFTKLSTGDRIKVDGNEYFINSISNSTSMSFTTDLATSFSANVFFKTYNSGDIIDLTANGSSGQTRTVVVSGGSLVIDLKEDTSSTIGTANTKLTYRINRNTAQEVRKTLNANRFVKIYTANNDANTVGPYNLGVSDVYKLRSVRMHSSDFSLGTEGSNVTSSFILDNGQRDNLYDHSKIIHVGSLDLSSKYLLVEFDHFVPDYSSGFGYFSVDSYPIDDDVASNTTIFTYEIPKYVSTSGVEYNLRDSLDFRPVKANTAVSANAVGSANLNPSYGTALIVDSDGLRIPAPDSDISIDYSFYLARRDVVTINSKNEFNVVKGEPGITPRTPVIPGNVMGIAKIFIPPYPSISETLARKIEQPKIGCKSENIAPIRFTMKDLGVMKKRIDNLEYYNALNLLEKSVVELKVVDANGLDRFKNGFFVDGFMDHSLGDTANPDYKIAIDKFEKLARPFFTLDSFSYEIETGASSGYSNTGGLITRPYTETSLIENRNVTTTRNIEQSVFRFVGSLTLSPSEDVWCDTSTVDKTFEYGNELPLSDTFNVEWGSWEAHAVGYDRYSRNFGDRTTSVDNNQFEGSFTSLASATSQGGRYKIETITEESRVGVQTTVTHEQKIEELGNFVTDVSVKPYIRPQTIVIYAKGLKANTRYFVYFDGEDMSSFVTPVTIPEAGVSSILGDIDGPGVTLSAEGSSFRSDEFGEILGLLRLPVEGKRFRVGTKEVVITDSPTNAIDATSYARSYFLASGISVTKQNTIVSTKVPVIKTEEIVESRSKQQVEVFGPSCMAYSFKVDVPRTEAGIFLTSIDVWVAEKHSNLGVWFEIREMNSAGSITRTQVPGSEVWLTNSEVNTWDGASGTEDSGKTTITFPYPIFLLNDTQYAFVIHTEGLNPDYYFWVSRLGETDILTGNQVTARQLTGTLFTTNNNLNYDIVPDVDLKVKFNRAQFSIGSGTVIFGNKPTEFINLKEGASSFIRNGETIISSEALTLSNTSNGANTIIVGDKVIGTSSNTSANVISIANSVYYTDGIGFIEDETYSITNSSDTSKSITGSLTSLTFGTGVLRKYDSGNNVMILDNSNGKFFANAVVKGNVSANTGRIESFDEFKYSTTTLKPYDLIFNKTSILFEKQGWLSNPSSNSFTPWISGSADSFSSLNTECTILSRVNEEEIVGQPSAKFKATISTSSEYVSPVIDVNKSQSIFVHNLVNNDDTGENQASGGNLLNKYISKPITLADGQDAEDLLVKLTAYKPVGSDIKVWMKVRNDEDSDLIRRNPWVEMVYNRNQFSSSASDINFIEIDFNVPENYKNGNGVVQYIKNSTVIVANTTGINSAGDSILITAAGNIFTANQEVYYSVEPNGTPIAPLTANTYYYIKTVNSTAVTLSETKGGTTINITDFRTDANSELHTLGGEVYSSFKQYSVKIGLATADSSNPPLVGDLRAIALQI
jgi:hypothetical protein